MSEMIEKYYYARECLVKGIPFALFIFPEESVESPHIFANDKQLSVLDSDNFDSFEGFVFNKFGISDSFTAYGIESHIELAIPCGSDSQISPFHYEPTPHDAYIGQVTTVVESLDSDNEKTVLSRVDTLDSSMDPIEVAEQYFRLHNGCFRYILYSSVSGLWFGASPELIADYSHSSQSLTTMSLAGTRQRTESESPLWDKKNILEHNIVTDFICDTLSASGMNVDVPVPEIVAFRNIEHLCHKITARGNISLSRLLPNLTPTPAICGWPRVKAMNQIADIELHDRNFYGGIIGVKDADRSRLFLNLRCAYVENPCAEIKRYALLGGGGITRHSEPATEWEETKMKIESLVKTIIGQTK